MRRFLICVCAVTAVLASCTSAPVTNVDPAESSDGAPADRVMLTREVNDRFQIGLTLGTPSGTEVVPMFAGVVHDLSRDPDNPSNLGVFVDVRTETSYYWDGEERSVELGILYSNMESVAEGLQVGDQVQRGDLLGTAGTRTSRFSTNNDLMVSMYSFSQDPYLRYLTDTPGTLQLDRYWFSAVNFIQGTYPNPDRLGYQEVEPQEFPFFDQGIGKAVRFYYELEDYPVAGDEDATMLYITAALNGSIRDLENSNYGPSSSFATEAGKVILLWPFDMVEQFQANQAAGNEVHIYARVGAVSDERKAVLLVVDDSSDLAPEGRR